MKCPNCGRHVKAGTKFCIHCGYPIQNGPAKAAPTAPKPKRSHKKGWIALAVLVVILLIGGGIWCKRYFTPAQAFSRQLPKSVWIENHRSKHVSKKAKKHHKSKRNKTKTHHSYIVSNGKQLLSFGKRKKSTKIFNDLSSNSKIGRQLRNNVSQNMKNAIIQGHYTYHIKGDSLYFNNGNVFKNVKKSKGGYTFKCYKGKKFLHNEHVKKYKSLSQPIK